MQAGRSECGTAWGGVLRLLLACTIAALPALHGHFHAGSLCDPKALIHCSATRALHAVLAAPDADNCPVCCLLSGGFTPPEAPAHLDEQATRTEALFVEQCFVALCLPFASFPPRAPPA
jgi:hypothetical protein